MKAKNHIRQERLRTAFLVAMLILMMIFMIIAVSSLHQMFFF